MKNITRRTRLNEVLEINPKAAEILFKEGLACVGCPATAMETLEQGCRAHGMSDKNIEELIKKLNKK